MDATGGVRGRGGPTWGQPGALADETCGYRRAGLVNTTPAGSDRLDSQHRTAHPRRHADPPACDRPPRLVPVDAITAEKHLGSQPLRPHSFRASLFPAQPTPLRPRGLLPHRTPPMPTTDPWSASPHPIRLFRTALPEIP
ncbi:hypothetical protein GCM10023205_19530 [Yinghuangia aomiensis]|uniref:Uncharacterized protein n=1 Tax=Yinghuangia aomiensis TaxID=676205 RepID=A0ABP9GYQ6_9ACTN